MAPKRFKSTTRSRLFIAISLGLMLMLLTAVISFAAIYTISTTDSTIAEWDNQGIPAFLLDPTGDTINGGTSEDDIVETRVATGNSGNTLYFLLKTNTGPAVNSLNHSAAAYIDCDRDGVTGEADDRIVTYIPHYSPLGIPPGSERVTLCWGDESQCAALGPDSGQQVSKSIEWGVDISELPANCQNDVNIKFYTAQANFGNKSTVLDETALKGWNIPTAVNLTEIEATASSWSGVVIGLMMLGLAVALSAVAWLWRRRTA
jgi:hypothetical protein